MTSGRDLREGLLNSAIEGTGGIRYHLRELLGEGGQGFVYKANYDDPDGFWVVVKVLRPESIQTESLKRFEREAEVLRMLGSVPAPNPNIVRFYDYGVYQTTEEQGEELLLPFIALEYVDGQTLGKVISAHGGFGLPIARVRRVMKQVARALHTVHERRIVHRDLKPSNILLTQHQSQEIAKVTDFGLVKLPELSAHRTATVAGASLGYAPPEQYEMGNNRVSVQTDVFSFAAILFEALCGSEAFPCKAGDNPLRVVARMLSSDRPSLARVSATVPRELRDRPDLTAAIDREIGRAVSADPSVRHATIRELWEQIEPLLRDASAGRVPSLTDEVSAFEGASSPASAPVSVPELRVTGRAMTGERLRAGTLSSDGRSIVAVGMHGLYLFQNGIWAALRLAAGIDARFIRGLLRLVSGDLCVYGDSGLAVTIAPSGGVGQIPLGDRDLTLLGAIADATGLVFVGERLSRPVGVLVEVPREGAARVRTIEGTTRLHGVARLGSGSLLVCGSHGDLLEVGAEASRDVAWGRTGHLYAVAAAPDGAAFAVGSGGHALRIQPALGGPSFAPTAALEVVQTTRDLTSVAVDVTGAAWAAGGQARLLQRRGTTWTRLSLDGIAQGQLVMVAPRGDAITVLGEDGMVVEGRNIA